MRDRARVKCGAVVMERDIEGCGKGKLGEDWLETLDSFGL